MTHILVLTHTNPDSDSRILKYLSFFDDHKIDYVAIGVEAKISHNLRKSTILIYPKLKKTIDLLTALPINHRYTRIFLRTFYYFEIVIKQIIAGVRSRAKVIHVHDWFSLPSGWIISRILNARLIYDAHELESDSNGVTKEVRFLVRKVEKFCWAEVDAFITVSNSILAWYMNEYGIKKSEVILNSPEISKVMEDQAIKGNHLKKKFEIERGSLIFLYIGVLEFGRGIEKYLEVFSKQEISHHLVFLGSGSLEYKIRETMKTNRRVHIHEPVRHDKVIHVAKSADFGLCLIDEVSMSDWLCLPNKFFEYAFAGLPIVVSDFPEMSEAVRSHSLGVAIGNSSDELLALLQDPGQLRKMKKLARASDLNELSLEHQRTKMQSIFLDS